MDKLIKTKDHETKKYIIPRSWFLGYGIMFG